jgi:phosphoenolpyruvate carboxykinase (ATP)
MATLDVLPADLGVPGLRHVGTVHYQLPAACLVELAIRRGEGQLTATGALAVRTGKHTGRSPKDRYIVPEAGKDGEIAWGPVNRRMTPEVFDRLLSRSLAYLQGREVFVQDGSAGADPAHTLPVRVIGEDAWIALFARCLFRDPLPPATDLPPGYPHPILPGVTILAVPGLEADAERDGTRTETFIVLNLARRLVLVGGTRYAGEIKKAVFSLLNYLLPARDVFPMHCAANVATSGETALFFGLSGTGKTTLSADPGRRLIGDDEHGWSDAGIFNIEGGCYAKTIRLSREGEPQIWNALRFGSVLENVVLDPATRVPDYDDESLTENTRAAYPVDHIEGAELAGQGAHPRTVLFLTCDAFGVLPPLARLSPAQALYHFLLGYTAKVAGTEAGITSPEATFSTCFAAPFLPRPAGVYAKLLREKLDRHRSTVWLVNTGYTGTGKRFPLAVTRALVRAALAGVLDTVPCVPDPIFNLAVPTACPDVPADLLVPARAWTDVAKYDAAARQLAARFVQEFAQYESQVSPEVRASGPRLK